MLINLPTEQRYKRVRSLTVLPHEALDFCHSVVALAGPSSLASLLTQLIQEELLVQNKQRGWGKIMRQRPKMTSRTDLEALISQSSLMYFIS